MIRNNLSTILCRDTAPSQASLARQVGISRPYMSMIVNEKHTPSSEVMFKIAHALGLAFGDVWWYENGTGVKVTDP